MLLHKNSKVLGILCGALIFSAHHSFCAAAAGTDAAPTETMESLQKKLEDQIAASRDTITKLQEELKAARQGYATEELRANNLKTTADLYSTQKTEAETARDTAVREKGDAELRANAAEAAKVNAVEEKDGHIKKYQRREFANGIATLAHLIILKHGDSLSQKAVVGLVSAKHGLLGVTQLAKEVGSGGTAGAALGDGVIATASTAVADKIAMFLHNLLARNTSLVKNHPKACYAAQTLVSGMFACAFHNGGRKLAYATTGAEFESLPLFGFRFTLGGN